jgi:hypothetical protein
VGELWAPDPPIRQAMKKEMQAAYNAYNPERIVGPALASYAAPKSPDDLLRWVVPTDSRSPSSSLEPLTIRSFANVERSCTC